MKAAAVGLATFLIGIAVGMYSMREQNVIFRAYRALARHSGMVETGRGRFMELVGKEEIACPDHALVLLVMGQSNAGNHLGMRHRGAAGVLNFWRGRCYAAQDPLLGATGNAGSLWTELGNKLVTAGYPAVVIAPFAIVQTRIEQWNDDLRPALDAALKDLSARYSPDLALWEQGEADAHSTLGEAYASQLRMLIAHVRATFPRTRWLIATATLCGASIDPAIERAQRSVIDGSSVLAGPNTDEVASLQSRSDGCHFSDVGQDLVTDWWLSAIEAAMH